MDASIYPSKDFVPARLFLIDLRENQGTLFLQLNLTILNSYYFKDFAIIFEKVKYFLVFIVQFFLIKYFVSAQVTADPLYLSIQNNQNEECPLLYIGLYFILPSISLLLSCKQQPFGLPAWHIPMSIVLYWLFLRLPFLAITTSSRIRISWSLRCLSFRYLSD